MITEEMYLLAKKIIESYEEQLKQGLVSGSVCDECGDGSGWYGNELPLEDGGITMCCSKCNPEAY